MVDDWPRATGQVARLGHKSNLAVKNLEAARLRGPRPRVGRYGSPRWPSSVAGRSWLTEGRFYWFLKKLQNLVLRAFWTIYIFSFFLLAIRHDFLTAW